jgi:hypothetical protein
MGSHDTPSAGCHGLRSEVVGVDRSGKISGGHRVSGCFPQPVGLEVNPIRGPALGSLMGPVWVIEAEVPVQSLPGLGRAAAGGRPGFPGDAGPGAGQRLRGFGTQPTFYPSSSGAANVSNAKRFGDDGLKRLVSLGQERPPETHETSDGGWGRNRTGVHGFAGRCITTLPPSRVRHRPFGTWGSHPKRKTPAAPGFAMFWSGKRDSNSRPQPWQGCALPLSYSRPTGTQ